MRDPRASHLDKFFDDAARDDQVAIVVLPRVNSESSIVALLDRLRADSERWALQRRAVEDVFAIGVEWRTPSGAISAVMGFGPFPKMPVTRRAPYATIALWPGVHRNPCRKAPRDTPRVSFVNAMHDLDCSKYDNTFSVTDLAVNELLREDGMQSKPYREVAFVVESDLAATVGL